VQHLNERRIEIRDADLEKSGAEFVDWEISYKLGYDGQSPCASSSHAGEQLR
jgi:hypothetical protein